MYTFLVVSLVTILISTCFFKGRTWDKRLFILGVIAVLTMITFVVIDLSTRDKSKIKVSYDTKVELSNLKFAGDTIDIVKKYAVYKDIYKIYNKILYKKAFNTHLVFMISGSDTTVYYSTNDKDVVSAAISKIFFRKNLINNDAFSIIKTVSYDRKRNNFYNPFALDIYLTQTVLVLPKSEFDMIPKGFIKPETFLK